LDKIRILQLGNEDWNQVYQLPGYVELTCSSYYEETPKKPFDLVFADRRIRSAEVPFLQDTAKAYCYYVLDDIMDRQHESAAEKALYECKKGQTLKREQLQDFLTFEARNYFAKPYGEKFKNRNIAIAQDFKGKVTWHGNYSVELEGDFGGTMRQIAFWKNNIPVFQGQAIDLWLEYDKDPQVEISMTVTQFAMGSISEVQNIWHFSQEELNDIVTIDNEKPQGATFFSISAKGKGRLRIVSLHDRYSRRGHGAFLPGGQRYVTSNREEVFAYFDPGDRKPPLNVYFSGYKTMEGFEGYNLMRKLKGPFLLISEARLEGGAFYMGSREYEQQIEDIIEGCLQELDFGSDELILSGLSMGTYGALYYGSRFRPHAIIVGKPLASMGDVAANERLFRPGGFPTSLDLLMYNIGSMDEAAIEQLNERFWSRFDAADWSRTKFIAAYMIEDDYDPHAYFNLLEHLSSAGVQVYGKGLHGRHNDDTSGIVGWFVSQFENTLKEDFSRGMYGK
jgi:accessory secretory protein Asp2